MDITETMADLVETITMPERYNVTEFAEFLGLNRRTLARYEKSGDVIPHRTPGGKPYYDSRHLDCPRVKAALGMKDLGRFKMGRPVKAKVVDIKSSPPVKKQSKKTKKPQLRTVKSNVSTFEDLQRLPEGPILENIPPLVGLTKEASLVWSTVFPRLIEQQEFYAGDVLTFRDYCSTGALINKLEEELVVWGYTLPDGRASPLLGELNRAKTLFKTLGTILHLTPDSRKHLKSRIQELSTDDESWAKVLQ